MHPLLKTVYANPSVILGLVAWGVAGFGFQPGFGTFLVHFVLVPPMIALLIWLAHWEGRRQAHMEQQSAQWGRENGGLNND